MKDPAEVPQDYFATDPGTGPHGNSGRQRLVVLVALAVAIGLGALAYQVAGDNAPGGDSEEAIDDDVSDTTVPDTAVTEIDAEPIEITPAAPWDGTASKFHPVSVQPATDLVDGSVVTVEGWEFPPDQDIGIVQCTNVAVVDGVGGCNVNYLSSAHTNADGYFIGEFAVHRYLHVNGEQWDCLQGNVDPVRIENRGVDGLSLPGTTDVHFTCVVAAGGITDYDESGGFPISFQGHPPFLPLPDAEVVGDTPTTSDPSPDPTTIPTD